MARTVWEYLLKKTELSWTEVSKTTETLVAMVDLP